MSTDAVAPVSRGTVVVTTLASDSHTWNLVFLQLLIEELGYTVVNLGPCVPDEVIVEACVAIEPDLVVVSTVNGHGHQEGLRVIGKLRARAPLAATPMVIGGKLGIAGECPADRFDELTSAGFDAVFDDAAVGIQDFRTFVCAISSGLRSLAETAP